MRNKKSLFIVLAIAVLALTLSVALVACGEKGQPEPAFLLASESEDGYATVYAPSDRDFRLMVLSDPQVDFFEKYKVVGSPGNEKTYEFIEDFVKETDPDLVIINGDLVMNDNFLVSSAPFSRDTRRFLKNCKSRGRSLSAITILTEDTKTTLQRWIRSIFNAPKRNS